MKIAVVGIGAVGGYFGGKLTQSSHELIFIARGTHLQTIQENGLFVESELGDFNAQPSFATDNPEEVGIVDLVILATKTWQVDEAAIQIKPLIGENTIILPLLNGVEAPHQLAQHYGEKRVLGGFCRVQSQKVADGHIRQGGTPPFVAMGAIWDNANRIPELAQVFKDAEIELQIPESIEAAMWQKLLFVGSFGSVGAVTRQNAGVLRTVPESRSLLEETMREYYELAIAQKIPMRPTAVADAMKLVDSFPASATVSMQRDILEGYPSELEAQVGVVLRLGEKFGLTTPINRFLYYSLLPSEQIARGIIKP